MSTSLRTVAMRAAICVMASGLFAAPAFAQAYYYNYYNNPSDYSSTSCNPYTSISCPATTYAQCRNGEWVCVLGNNNVQLNKPSIHRLSPSSGAAGSTVTIEGTNFLRTGNEVHFGSTVIRNVSSVDGSRITFVVPYARNATCSSNSQNCGGNTAYFTTGSYRVWVSVPRRGNNYNNNGYYGNNSGCSHAAPSCASSWVSRCVNGAWTCSPTYQDDYGYNNYNNSYTNNGSCPVSQPSCGAYTPVCRNGVWMCSNGGYPNNYYNGNYNYNYNQNYNSGYNYNQNYNYGGACNQPRPNCGNWTPNCVSGAWRCDPPGGNYSVAPYGGGYYQGNVMYQGGGAYYGY